MKVWIDVGESQVTLGYRGIVLHVADGRKKVGRLRIGSATVEWFPGRTSKNTKKVRLADLLDYIEENG